MDGFAPMLVLMQRRTPLTAVPWERRKVKSEPDPIRPETRTLVTGRSAGWCELCTTRRGVHLHHRQLRRAGDHSAANLVHLCGTCHNRVHSHPAWSYETGWLVSQYVEPLHAPLLLGKGHVLLTLDGRTIPA